MFNNSTMCRRSVPLPFSIQTALFDIGTVRAARGITAEQVIELVKLGQLVWVFDLGLKRQKKHIRSLFRFWSPEICNADSVKKLKLDEVISRILLPNHRTFSGSEIGNLFLVGRATVKRIGAETRGVVKSGRLCVQREPLVRWLRQRWIGGGQ
jgi:hypothetical protein